MSLRALAARALLRPAAQCSSGSKVHTVDPGACIGTALSLMSDKRVGALVVCADGEGAVGIVTERDVLEKLDFDAPLASVTAASLMTPVADMATADDGPAFSLEHAMAAMHHGHFRHLPVVQHGAVTGMLSMRDAARELAKAAADAIAQPDSAVAAAASLTAADLVRARSRSVQITPSGGLPVGPPSPPSCIEVPQCATVGEAVLEMRRWKAGSVLVPVLGGSIAESRHGFGIFTERDYIRLLGSAARLEHSLDARTVPVSRVMTSASDIRFVGPDDSAARCLGIMASEDIRHLPVMVPEMEWALEQHRPLGETPPQKLLAVLSMRDLLTNFLPTGGT